MAVVAAVFIVGLKVAPPPHNGQIMNAASVRGANRTCSGPQQPESKKRGRGGFVASAAIPRTA